MQLRPSALLLCVLAACGAPGQRPAPAATGPGAVRAASHAPPQATIDVEHYALDLRLDPTARELEGSARVRFYGAADALREIELALVGLEVAGVRDARGRELTWRHADGRLGIELAEPLLLGDSGEVVVDYAGAPRKGLWFAGGEPGGAATHAFTQGECEDARWWFPCQDAPFDRATSEVRVRVPASWTTIAAGRLVESSVGSVERVDRWRMDTPHPTYLMTLVAGELAVAQDEWRGVPLSYHAPPEVAPWLESSLAATGPALDFLTEFSGARYPYAKYATCAVDNFPFGGMENISATTITTRALSDARGLADESADGLVLHEAAHQWFGNLLTCRDWSHIWLNEGFATYATNLYFEQSAGVDDFRVRMRAARETYLAGDTGRGRRAIVSNVWVDPIDLFFGGHSYSGGATRLHLLRFVLGDEAFRRGVRLYVGRNRGRGVVTGDLRTAMEEASGVELSAFFEQWLEAPGHPELEVRWRYDAAPGQVTLSVNQVQDIEGGTPAAFRMPVLVEINGPAGIEQHRIELGARREQFRFPVAAEPTWVRFDKYGWLPARIEAEKSAAEWLAIAAADDDVGGRLDAVAALGALAAARGVDELARASFVARLETSLRQDAAAALRAAAAAALGQSRAGREALVRAAEEDAAPSVRVAALGALARFGEDADLARVGREAYAQGASWKTMVAAAGLVVAADPAAGVDWLRAHLDDDSPHGVLEAGLLSLLGSLRVEGVTALLLARLEDPAEAPQVREAAARALAPRAARSADLRARLGALLDTPWGKLRRELVRVLAETREPDALALLARHHERSLVPRERRIIEAVWSP